MIASTNGSDGSSNRGSVRSAMPLTAAKAAKGAKAAAEAHDTSYCPPQNASLVMSSSQRQHSCLSLIQPQRHDDDDDDDDDKEDDDGNDKKGMRQKRQYWQQHQTQQHYQRHGYLYSIRFQQNRSGQTASSCIDPHHQHPYSYQHHYLSKRCANFDVQLHTKYRQDASRFILENKASPVYTPMKISAALERLARLMERRTAAYEWT
jgi:hypothetical protein